MGEKEIAPLYIFMQSEQHLMVSTTPNVRALMGHYDEPERLCYMGADCGHRCTSRHDGRIVNVAYNEAAYDIIMAT